MAISRYTRTTRFDGGSVIGVGRAANNIFTAIEDGRLEAEVVVVHEGQRLDTISHEVYGDSQYWWIIAAASGIGWWLQVPPGPEVVIPNLNEAMRFVA